MSRPKKEYTPGKPERNLQLTDKFAFEVTKFIWNAQAAIDCAGKADVAVKVGGEQVALCSYDQLKNAIFADLINHFAYAANKKDGSFFREVADCIEQGYSSDKLRQWLIHFHFEHGIQRYFFTTFELSRLVVKIGVYHFAESPKDRVDRQQKNDVGVKILSLNIGEKCTVKEDKFYQESLAFAESEQYIELEKHIRKVCKELGIKLLGNKGRPTNNAPKCRHPLTINKKCKLCDKYNVNGIRSISID